MTATAPAVALAATAAAAAALVAAMAVPSRVAMVAMRRPIVLEFPKWSPPQRRLPMRAPMLPAGEQRP